MPPLRRSIALIPLLAGCDPHSSLFSGEPSQWTTTHADLAPPAELTIDAGELAAGYRTTIDVTGADPGEIVRFLVGPNGGGTGPCPSPAGGLCLGTGASTILLDAVPADADGEAHTDLTIPGHVGVGRTIALQALVIRGADGAESVATDVLSRVLQEVRTLDDAVPDDLVTTEIMSNPDAVPDSAGEWFEIRNDAPFGLDLFGLEVGDASGVAFAVDVPLWVPSGGHAVLGAEDDPALNGGVHGVWQWPSYTLANTSDSVVLSYDGVVLHEVAWDDGATFPDPVGASLSHDPAAVDWGGSTWCEGSEPYGDGDLGSPGTANPPCPGDDSGLSYDTDEDFETGDFSPAFDYQHSGPNPWEIEADAASCYEGSYCMRTSPFHAGGETASVELSLSVREDTTVSFWARVNTEPDEHFFRFYVDGALQLELSGPDTGWQRYTFPVDATGPGGEDRTLTWEYDRSDFIDGGHVPWNEVWIDDIDMPSWNTAPTVPELLSPGNGTVTDDDSPTFEWTSSDPDLDPITYEVEWDLGTDFSAPWSSGELGTDHFTPAPLDDDTTYFWRVRAKDDSDYRWSDWSEVRALSVETSSSVPAYWRQSIGDEFDMNELIDMIASSGELAPVPPEPFDYTGPDVIQTGWGTVMYNDIVAPPAQPGTPATITVTVHGVYNSDDEYVAAVFLDGEDILGPNWYPGGPACEDKEKVLIVDDISEASADGLVEIDVDPNGTVYAAEGTCGWWAHSFVRLQYTSHNPGWVTSVPVDYSLFGDVRNWDKVQVVGTGDITLQILDGDGELIPDTYIPGNAAGHTERTVLLSGLDPAEFPVIRLYAHLEHDAVIEEWTVTANDGFDWTFDHDGDTEGWVAGDFGATPTLDAFDGVLRFDSDASGTDPNVELFFPVAVDASDFTTLEVTLRTSNTFNDDDVTVFWSSNYGDIDLNRSFSTTAYLYELQTIVFDLTEVPAPPSQPFQGQIESIRLDPVVQFLDAVAAPTDGWFEIDRVVLY